MSTEGVTGKPKLSRKQLQDHGIEYIDGVFNIDELDPWLREICLTITRLQEHVPKATRKAFKKEMDQFSLHGQDSEDALQEGWCLTPAKNLDHLHPESYTTPAAVGDHMKPESCEKALRAVRQCRKRIEGEDKWARVLCNHVFWDFHETYSGSSSYEQKLNGWELHQNILWNEFLKWARLEPSIAQLTQPKPDLTYGFPVIVPDKDSFRASEGREESDSFSLTILEQLRNRGKESLISTPTTALYNWASKKNAKLLEAKDQMCFPWAVVEIKRGTAFHEQQAGKAEARAHENRKRFCYCQAANASAAGLTLREDLAARANDTSELGDARVMFSFTCVGSAVKLWLTYREKPVERSDQRHESGGIIMVCIWATSLEISWGIIALRMILKNVQDWAHTRVKPEIRRWIHDVYKNRNRKCSLTPDGDIVTQRRRAASCGPSNGIVEVEESVERSCYRTPRQKKRPALPHGETAPEPRDRRRDKANIPQFRLNGLSELDGDDSSDEGYASIHTTTEDESEEEEETKRSSVFICNDELYEGDSDASYVPPSSEDENTGSESDGSSDGSANSDGDSSDEAEYNLSDGESHRKWLKQQSRAISRPEVYCTPTKGYKLSVPVDNKARRDRRRSSRF
ncbi:hypothetical protein HBI56_198720 [Parastagonospora nodorum]|nr:hypothetical protein HBI10_210260 [Parastagonospora nodorum]KAH4010681.1 hypothetical protein HBI13_205950 [Parastagonospora nodorum]KAH4911985.1 hypothetical protein HBH74_168680 [Parastagonospora nodorum]KAH4928348.1 hypothetical protein HBH73_198480 [Parastagonospora nodorum]KAH4956665.1 hypothetical protein HBI78_199520 [Parastagonospora nodorum]